MAFDITLSPQGHGGSAAPRRSDKGHRKPIDGSPHGLDRTQNTPVAPNLEQSMCQADQTPFATDGRQATQQEASEPTRFFDLATHRFHDHLTSGVQCLACRRPHFRCHALLHCGKRLRGFRLRHMVLLAPSGDIRIEPSGLQGHHCRLTVIAIIQGHRDGVGGARLVLWTLKTRLGEGR